MNATQNATNAPANARSARIGTFEIRNIDYYDFEARMFELGVGEPSVIDEAYDRFRVFQGELNLEFEGSWTIVDVDLDTHEVSLSSTEDLCARGRRGVNLNPNRVVS